MDARKLLQRHQELQARLAQISKVGAHYKEAVKSAKEHYVTSEVIKAIRGILVGELNEKYINPPSGMGEQAKRKFCPEY